jgi:RES domain-containing protein
MTTRRLPDERDLRPLLETIKRISFRTTSPDRNPLALLKVCPWAGRYHPLLSPQALYTSLKKQTSIRELEHHGMGSMTGAEVRQAELEFAGRVLNVADLDGQEGLHITTDDLVDDDVALCHDVARFAKSLEVDGILVPSAAYTGNTNLVVLYESVSDTVRLLKSTLIRI